MMNAKDILVRFWGHAAFRLKQEQIINEVIEKRDTLALLPTGGGKSICYQVPSLMQDGICLVISPLISLMDDQIRFLSSKGIKSIAITSGMHYNEIDTALTNCIYGGVKFLYLSPERIQNKLVQDRLSEMTVNLITVDEAHCISEWGHNFRPSYRYISTIRSICKEAPLLALTATATKNTIDDIQNNLEFKRHNLIRSSFFRENLSYVVDNIEDKKGKLLKLVEKIKSSVIVYVGSRKATKEIVNLLIANNYSANYYHGGLSSNIRKKRQEDWLNNQTRIMVATNAFGMGIDKADVKLVVHMELPSTIESYFQEAGRAGRNGKQAYSFLLANRNDVSKQEDLLKLRYPEIYEIKECYQNLANFLQIAENTLPQNAIIFDIVAFSNRYNMSNLKTYNILKYLEKEGYLKLSDSLHLPSKIMIIVNNSELYKFQIANQHYDIFLKLLLRSYTNLFANLTIINENQIAAKLNCSVSKVKQLLKKLEQLEIIKYQPKNDNSQITFLTRRVDSEHLNLDVRKWKDRKAYEQEKLNNIVDFIQSTDKCRSSMLISYFGEKDVKNCEKCDYCIKQKRKELKKEEFRNISTSIQNILTKKELPLKEIYILLPEINKDVINNVLQFLFENDKIIKFGNKYQWKVN